MGDNKKTKKIEVIDSWEVNQISIAKVAQDIGLELYPRGRGLYTAYCPNPEHADNHLGNFMITDNGIKNCFHCFVCGIGGGPIDLVMIIDKCDFITAKNKLAKQYGLIKVKYVDESDLPPKWDGLSAEEYKSFGLQNVTMKFPYDENDSGETLFNYDRYSLRDLARDEPDVHDKILLGKFAEKISNIAKFLALLDCGYFIRYADNFELCYSKNWENICVDMAKRYCVLLKKGLIDKTKLNEIFVLIPDFLKKSDFEDQEDLEPEEEVSERSNRILKKAREKAKAILLSKRQKSVSNL